VDVAPAAGEMRGELGWAEAVRRPGEDVARGVVSLDAIARLAERRDALPDGGARAAEELGELLA
jgi:hypothetical protein